MIKVITYGTFDILHYGHIRLLERAKKLGDYLIVGVTADDFDRTRGKINVRQSLSERIEAVKSTGLADKIIVEEYEGQKIDDIKRYDIDIFTVGSDWKGTFDYLDEYCKVVYLERTKGVSSTQIRSEKKAISMGIVGDYAPFLSKFKNEDRFVNGIEITGICTNNIGEMSEEIRNLEVVTKDYDELLKSVDSVYIKSDMQEHYIQIKKALKMKKNVLYESPLCDDVDKAKELFELAKENKCVLMEAIRTAYTTAFSRLLLLLKSGKIGNVLSIDASCTSIKDDRYKIRSFENWGPTALLPVFQILGTNYKNKNIIAKYGEDRVSDLFTQINFIFEHATATIKVAERAKTEGHLIITGTKGYVYIPAPWWKTDYFEVRFENPLENKRYFYQLDGEGIRYELVAFVKAVQENKDYAFIEKEVSYEITKIISDFKNKKDLEEI